MKKRRLTRNYEYFLRNNSYEIEVVVSLLFVVVGGVQNQLFFMRVSTNTAAAVAVLSCMQLCNPVCTLTYSNNIFKIFAQYLHNICTIFAPYLHNICTIFALYLHNICMLFVKYSNNMTFYQIFQTKKFFAQYLHNICTIFLQYLHNIRNIYAKYYVDICFIT